ncbi:hypothetical protein ACQEVZ_55510 [Dactylosporangium sp. CA-152071]|uniref:hypothetical protein n=1 Tax=Dactylosporangium sp. CA-152071 TaxID=3239933 RepID=UPI003D8B2059
MTNESLTVGQIFASHTDRLPAVKLPDLPRSGILVGQDSSGHIELAGDSVILPVDPDTRAELITDPVTRAWLLTEAFARTRRTYLWAVGELATERQHVQDARQDRERLLGDVRAFLVERVRDGQLDQQDANAFLRRHHLPAYAPRLRVAYTVTGEFEIDGEHDPEDGRLDHLIAVDLDGITNVDRGTERHQVQVTSTRIDVDHRPGHA